MPSPVEALPCGSRSMTSTRSPIAASAVPRLIAVVVLPTPPFWLAIASTRGALAGSVRSAGASAWESGSMVVAPADGGRVGSAGHKDSGFRVCLTRDQRKIDAPVFSRLGQFSSYILTLQE